MLLVRYTATQGGGRFTGHFDQEEKCMPATMMVYLTDVPEGELNILLTVTFCANPANNLTCPHPYIL